MNSDWFSGAVNTLAGVTDVAKQIANPRYALLKEQILKQTQMDEKKLDAFLKSQRIMDNFRQAQIDAIKGGRTIYGGRGSTTTDKPLSVNEIQKFGNGMTTLIKEVKKFRPGMYDYDQADLDKQWQKFVEISGYNNLNRTQQRQLQNIWKNKIDNLGNEVENLRKGDIREYFGAGRPTEPVATGQGQLSEEQGEVTGQKQDIRDYFGGTTTAPKTFGQIGINDADDMSTLQEMQKALPDRDLRQEYEDDPENMKRLMKLWKQGKLNKSNIHKAFSKIQQSAQQALGIA